MKILCLCMCFCTIILLVGCHDKGNKEVTEFDKVLSMNHGSNWAKTLKVAEWFLKNDTEKLYKKYLGVDERRWDFEKTLFAKRHLIEFQFAHTGLIQNKYFSKTDDIVETLLSSCKNEYAICLMLENINCRAYQDELIRRMSDKSRRKIIERVLYATDEEIKTRFDIPCRARVIINDNQDLFKQTEVSSHKKRVLGFIWICYLKNVSEVDLLIRPLQKKHTFDQKDIDYLKISVNEKNKNLFNKFAKMVLNRK